MFVLNILLASVVVVLTMMFLFRRKRGLPPGPFPLPFIGNLLHLTGSDPLCDLRNLRDKYGDIFSLSIGQSVTVVLSGYDVIHDALVKKGAYFSNRPNNLFSREVLGRGIVYGNEDVWKSNRKFAQLCLQAYGFSKSAVSLEERIQNEIQELISVMERNKGPTDFTDIFNKALMNVISRIICSSRHDYDDADLIGFIANVRKSVEIFTRTTVLSDCFPFLQYFPGDILGINFIKDLFVEDTKFYNKFIEAHKTRFDSNNIRDLIDKHLSEVGNAPTGSEEHKNLCSIIGDLLGAGSETSATTIKWLILYLLNNPEVQHKLHSDIDDVIGHDRRPTLEDRSRLPYVQATILETLRISTPAPLAIPHTANEDIVFRGFLIPKNSTVFVNIDATMKDPRIWDEPLKFRPERFLDADGQLNVPKEFIVFSVGRRSCLGESLARMELFLFVTSLLQRFEFVAPSGTCPPKPVGKLGLTYSPLPYSVEALGRKKK